MFFNFFKFHSRKLPPTLFLHIHKTAGTSIIDLMRQYYGESFISGVDYLGHMPNEFENTKFVSGHMGYKFANSLMPGRFTFTFLRNPNERILSLYHYCRSRNPSESIISKLSHKLSLSDFLLAGLHNPRIKLHIWNNQVWQLAHGYTGYNKSINANLNELNQYSEIELLNLAKKHLTEFSYVGFTETTEYDIKNILNLINAKQPKKVGHINKSSHPSYDDLPENDKQTLGKLTNLDWQLYNHAWEVYHHGKYLKGQIS